MAKRISTLRNNKYQIIGYIEEVDCRPGDLCIRNDRFQILGYYYPKKNQTWDIKGHFIGEGNLLTTLLDTVKIP